MCNIREKEKKVLENFASELTRSVGTQKLLLLLILTTRHFFGLVGRHDCLAYEADYEE